MQDPRLMDDNKKFNKKLTITLITMSIVGVITRLILIVLSISRKLNKMRRAKTILA